MEGKGLGVANVATGITLLAPSHDRVLFAIGLTLLLSGIAIFTVSAVLGRKRTTDK